MKRFYTAPTATVAASPPNGTFHALVCPGAPAWSLVVVQHFHDHASEDAWEDLPNVNEHYIENWGQTVPPAVVTAFGVPPYNVVATDTIRQALQKVRRQWPMCRP